MLSPLRARKSDNVGRAITLKRPYTKKDAKRIKSDNFTRSNREKSNNAIAILDGTIIISYFGGMLWLMTNVHFYTPCTGTKISCQTFDK